MISIIISKHRGCNYLVTTRDTQREKKRERGIMEEDFNPIFEKRIKIGGCATCVDYYVYVIAIGRASLLVNCNCSQHKISKRKAWRGKKPSRWINICYLALPRSLLITSLASEWRPPPPCLCDVNTMLFPFCSTVNKHLSSSMVTRIV